MQEAPMTRSKAHVLEGVDTPAAESYAGIAIAVFTFIVAANVCSAIATLIAIS